jgi:hypothetical protein
MRDQEEGGSGPIQFTKADSRQIQVNRARDLHIEERLRSWSAAIFAALARGRRRCWISEFRVLTESVNTTNPT